jgi:predicted ABC-type transport system involved in lysophospholipase L1 biosynthesis ATPase subunit
VPEGADAPLLELTGIAKTYTGLDDGASAVVLKDIDLRVSAGESVAIVGASGCGKSTLLNIIGTLDRPDAGKVLLAGRDLRTLSENELAGVRGREIGFIFQLHHLLPQLSVLENVLVPTLAVGPEKRTEKPEARAIRLLERVGLSHRLEHRPGQLSGGERQRAAVVRALINEPGLLLADEPTGALDRAGSDRMADLLVELNREEGVSLIVVTHSPALADRMGRALELVDGRLGPRGLGG